MLDYLAESQKLLERAPTSKDTGIPPPSEGMIYISKYPGYLPDIACYNGHPRTKASSESTGPCCLDSYMTLHMAPEEDL
ncbi:hypothetical protein TNCV_3415691 [Trichonephila clavipes]|nr:hypothetical protein TNCV_3415691 [Trichonephila clavipes]